MDFGSQLLGSALTYMPVNRQFAPRNSWVAEFLLESKEEITPLTQVYLPDL